MEELNQTNIQNILIKNLLLRTAKIVENSDK